MPKTEKFRSKLLGGKEPWLDLPEFETGTAAQFEAYHGGGSFDWGVGAFFTNDPSYAGEFGPPRKFKVSIKNPLVASDPMELTEILGLDTRAEDKSIRQLRKKLPSVKQRVENAGFRSTMAGLDKKIKEAVEEAGYDSAIVKDWRTTEIRVFSRGSVKALPKQAKDMGEVQNIVNEMMALLPPGMPKPGIRLVNQMRSHWLGRTSWGYRERSGVAEWDETTEILVQRRVLGHDETLRRVIAHELCHHWDIMANDMADLKKMGVRTFLIYQRAQSKHGANWKEFASIFNAKYGQGFVTEKSNKDYVEDMSAIPEYFLLLQRMPNGHIHYQVAMRLGPKQQKWVNAHAGHPEYRLLKSKEPEFFRGPAIASGRWAYAREADAQRKEKLQAKWDSAQAKTSAEQAAKVAALKPSEQQRMESLFSKTALPSFILPAGEKIDTTEDSHLGHTRYIYGDPDNDRLDEFLKTTGAVRVIYPEFTGEEYMGVEMFKMPTAVQVREIASALKTFGGRYLWWDIRPLKAHGKGTIGEFQRALAGAKQAKDGRQPIVKSADADKPPRKNASTQINITGEAAYRMKQVASKFPKDELAGDGIEDHPHITVKFGVQEDGEALAKVAREFEPFDITFGKLHAFEPSESSDGAAPIVVLIESPELLKLNAAVKAAISNREDDFEYKPHATLAYVRPDVVDKYEGSALFEGMEFRVGAITLSGKDRAQTNIALGSGKAVTAAVRNREHSLTMGAEIEGFPPVVVIRWPQKGMRWRTVLTIVKQIAGDVAGRRVPWRAIHVFESPWGSKIEQDEQWEDWSAKKKFIMYDILEDGAFVSVGKPSAAQRKEAAQPGVAVYRGETPGGQPAGFAATFVSESPDSAAQYGAVRRLALDPDAEFLDMDSPEAHRLVEEFRGEKLSKEDFDDLAPEHFMFPDEAWREFLTGKGYNGTRMGKDLAVFDAGMLKAGSHKETPLEDTVYPHFEMDDAGQETQAYANLPDRVDGATAVPSLEELVPGRFEKKADTDSEPVSAPAFAYHVTQREYLGSIASKGLLPRPAEQVEGVTGNVLFFQADQPYASAPGLQDEVEIVLKAKLPQVPAFQDTDNPGRPSFYIRASVPPANLWVVEKGRETPLLRYTQQMVTASAQWDKVREYKNGKIEFHKGGIFIEVVPHKPPSGVKITLRDSSREGRGGVRPYMHYINYPKKYEGYEPPKGKTWEDIGLVWPPDERCIMVPEAEWSKPGYTAFDTITREQKEQAAEKELQSYLAVISRLKQGSVTASDFKAWFRGSKVVDEKGQPLLVYHGTTNLGFTEFEQRPGTISTVFGPEHVQRTGFFFTPEKSFAEEFTGVDNGAGYSREGRVMPVYLSIKNPADFSNGISDKLLDQLTKAGMNDRWLLYAGEQWEMFDGEDGAMLVSKLKQLGYDGAIIVEPDENRKETLSYIAFSPSQIRPATKTAAYAEAQNQVQHTRHDNVSISKTPKDDPFAEERSEPGQAKEAAYGDTEPPYFWFEPGFDPKAKEFIMGNRNCDDETLCCQDEASCWEGKLKTAGFDARLIYGEFGKDREGHWWVEVGGKIFDPTAAQFRLYEDESLRQQPDRGLYITAKGKTVGEAYLLHFNIPAGASIAPTREDANKDFHARHYLGWAEDATARIKSHYEGTSGVKIIDAIHRKNITFTVARTWGGVTRKFERRLKDQGGLSRHCPICKQQGLIPASRYRGKAVENAQVAPEAQGSGPDFVESD